MESENGRYEQKSDDDRMVEELVNFIEEHSYSKEEIQEAYFRVCGVVDPEKDNERITALHNEMERMTKNRFPLNRFARVVDTYTDIEDNGGRFIEFVQGLPLTEKEKRVLLSIVEKKRNGTLALLSQKDGATLQVWKIDFDTNKNVVAMAIQGEVAAAFEKFKDVPLNITFSED